VVAVGSPKELISSQTPGFVGIFEGNTQALLEPHLQPTWQTFNQARQFCIRTPQIEELIGLQSATGVTAIQLRPANLEDVYLKLTGEELSEDE
jgi:lipooligosaccharide transport system ATP-binding protein